MIIFLDIKKNIFLLSVVLDYLKHRHISKCYTNVAKSKIFEVRTSRVRQDIFDIGLVIGPRWVILSRCNIEGQNDESTTYN